MDPQCYNYVASCEFRDTHESMLSPTIFTELTRVLGLPEIVMLASRLNKQLDKYAPWMPDSNSVIIVSMSVFWEHMYICAFLPFTIIWQTSSKLSAESEKVLINSSNMGNSDLVYSCIKNSDRQPLIVHNRHLEITGTKARSPSAHEIKSASLTLFRRKVISSRLPEKLTKSLLQHGHYKQNEDTNQFSKMRELL